VAFKLDEVVLGWFEDDGWNLTPSDDGHTWVASVEGENGRWPVLVQVFADRGVFACYSLAPVSPPASRHAEVLAYLTRANAGLVTGNFEVDLDTGEIRYKTAIDLSDVDEADLASGAVVRALVADLTYTNVATLDRYLPGLLQVVAGSASAADAVAAIEAS
jgi:hypothetical protein